MNKHSYIVLVSIFFFTCLLQAQNKKATVGISIRSIVPNTVFRTKNLLTESQPNFNTTLVNKPSYSFGMTIRKNIGKTFALESGIFQTKRNYRIDLMKPTDTLSESFSMNSFEIPIAPLLYVQLNEKWHANISSGLTLNFFPSNLGNEEKKVEYEYLWAKNGWVQPSSLTSVGMEYRSLKSGYFYAGISYQVYFNDIYDAQLEPKFNFFDQTIFHSIDGNYACIELKYFFPEDQRKNKK